MGLASLGLEIGILCDFLYSVILFTAILGLYFLGLALSRPQVCLNGLLLTALAAVAAVAGALGLPAMQVVEGVCNSRHCHSPAKDWRFTFEILSSAASWLRCWFRKK